MVQTAQKMREQRIFSQFLHAEGVASPVFNIADSPDIECFINGQGICFELVDYFKEDGSGNSAQLQEQLQERLMQQAQRLYFAQQGHRAWNVTASFFEHSQLHKQEVERLAQHLVQFISGIPLLAEFSAHEYDDDLPPELQSHLQYLRCTLLPEDDFCCWYPSQTVWVPPLDPYRVAAILAQKERKLPRYRERCPAAPQILLIYVNAFSFSSLAYLEWNDVEPIQTPFDGVVVFSPDYKGGQMLWLKPCQAWLA